MPEASRLLGSSYRSTSVMLRSSGRPSAMALCRRFAGSHGRRHTGSAHFSSKGLERPLVHNALQGWKDHSLLEPRVLLEGRAQFEKTLTSERPVTAGQDR